MLPLNIHINSLFVKTLTARNLRADCQSLIQHDKKSNNSDWSFIGEDGHRSHYLSYAKRALYHLSYIPVDCCQILANLIQSRCSSRKSSSWPVERKTGNSELLHLRKFLEKSVPPRKSTTLN